MVRGSGDCGVPLKCKGRGSYSYCWLVLLILELAEVENQTWVRLGR